jgi:hypothetical protein
MKRKERRKKEGGKEGRPTCYESPLFQKTISFWTLLKVYSLRHLQEALGSKQREDS